MKIIKFIVCLALLYFLIYSSCLGLGLWALVNKYYTAESFLRLVLLVGSFVSVFFSTLISFFQKVQTADLGQVQHRFGTIYVNLVFCVVTILGLGLITGVVLDIFNIGFTQDIQFDFYFLIVQSSLGVYSGNLINSIFNYLEKIRFREFMENQVD